MEGTNNLTTLFFSWWYGEAYNRLFKYIRAVYIYLTDLFSVKICLKTLFAVWKRDSNSYEGLALTEKFQVWTLNLASRFIGLLIKLITIASYSVAVAITSICAIILIIIWPFYPLLVVYVIYLGITKLL